MKKKYLFFLLFMICKIHAQSQSIDSLSFVTSDGNTFSMSTYAGQKVLFFIAPTNPVDYRFKEVDSFYHKHGTNIKMIGILSAESGHHDSLNVKVKSFYQERGINIILTKTLYVQSTNNSIQSDLLKWLSKKSLNKRFETEIKDGMYKFFIEPSGKLFSVLKPEQPLFSNFSTLFIQKSF